jgi:hypothetical protein
MAREQDRFLIAPINTGLQTNLRPWLIPDDAFEQLDNAYVFRGRVRKRFGSALTGTGSTSLTTAPLFSRVRIPFAAATNLGLTDGAGAAAGAVAGATGFVGQKFMIGNEIFTVISNTPGAQPMSTTGASPVHTFDVSTGAYVFNGAAANTTIYFFPSGGGALAATTDAGGNSSGIVPGSIFKIGQAFSIGEEIFTVNALGAPANMIRTGTTVTAEFNTTTGFFNFAGAAPNTIVFFYPAEPIMGLTLYEQGAIIEHDAYAFDTQFSYLYSGGSWNRSGTTVWHGNNHRFFWSSNYEGANASTVYLFVTNFNAVKNGAVGVNDDPMYYFDGTTWTAFYPQFLVAGNRVNSARIIIPFKDRLVLLNTIESDAAHANNLHYPARCRYSHNGSPLPTVASSWLEHNQTGWDGAGWIDAATDEEIISAEFIKDRLIVYFEKSTWELAYTGNQIQPFVWQKINTELGSDATFSSVPFDKTILTIGQSGIHACSGANVERIDSKIPNQIFNIRSDNNGIERIAGIRDYYTEMVYWTFPQYGSNAFSDVYPNKVLVYNYKNDSWAINDDCITALGYFEQQDDITWQLASFLWSDTTYTWTSGVTQADFRQILAGNQEGYIFMLLPDVTRNAPVMQVTDAVRVGNELHLTIVDHTLEENDCILLENGFSAGPVLFEYDRFIFPVSIVDANTVSLGDIPLTLTYLGGATAARVSNIRIKSKQWNPYINTGEEVQLNKIDFCVAKTEYGEITVDYFPSSSNISLITDGVSSGAILGNNILETRPYPGDDLEQTQNRLWHTVYFQGEGNCIQILITFNQDQITINGVALEDFQLEGLILYTSKSGRLK